MDAHGRGTRRSKGRGVLLACACMALAFGTGPAGGGWGLARHGLRAADAIGPPIRRSRPAWRAAASWSVLWARRPVAYPPRLRPPRLSAVLSRSPRGSAPCLFLRGGDTAGSKRKGGGSVVGLGWAWPHGWLRGWLAAVPVRRPDGASEARAGVGSRACGEGRAAWAVWMRSDGWDSVRCVGTGRAGT